MRRVSVFFIATVLLFSLLSVSLAQQDAIQVQAKTDAHTDVNRDMRESLWFLSGLASSSLGVAAGGAGAFLGGMLIGDVGIFPDEGPSPEACIIAGSIVCGVVTVPAAIFLYPHQPSPPLERLLGKPAAYIDAYLHAYRSKTVSLRKRWVTSGSLTANVGIGALLLRDIIVNR